MENESCTQKSNVVNTPRLMSNLKLLDLKLNLGVVAKLGICISALIAQEISPSLQSGTSPTSGWQWNHCCKEKTSESSIIEVTYRKCNEQLQGATEKFDVLLHDIVWNLLFH